MNYNSLAKTSFTCFLKWRNKMKLNLLALQHSLNYRYVSINLQNKSKHLQFWSRNWHEAFKNGLSKICWRQSLKYLKWYGQFKKTFNFYGLATRWRNQVTTLCSYSEVVIDRYSRPELFCKNCKVFLKISQNS